MPIFEYQCECGIREERIVNKHDAEVICKCGKTMTKLLTAGYKIRMSGSENQLPGKRYT